MEYPKKIGEPIELFPRQYGKTTFKQKFSNPKTRIDEDFILFDLSKYFASFV